jgi:hypothetical protein
MQMTSEMPDPNQPKENTVAKGEWQVLDLAERSRVYVYPNGEKLEYANVTRVKVSESGNHYLEASGKKAIVAPGWQEAEWTTRARASSTDVRKRCTA